MSLSPDGGLLAVAGSDGSIRVWDSLSEDLLLSIEGENEPRALAIGHTQPVLAAADATTITLWDLASGEARSLWKQELGEQILSLDFHRSGELLAVGMSTGQYVILDAQTGTTRQTVGAISPVSRLLFTPDGAIIVTGGTDGLIRYWNVSDGQSLYTGQIGHDAPVTALTVTNDGLLLASGGGDNVVKIYDGYTASWLNTLQGNTGAVQTVAFSPDGTLLASGDATGALRIWDVVLGQQVFEAAFAHVDGVTGLAWSPDGSTLYSAGMDGTVTMWHIPSPE